MIKELVGNFSFMLQRDWRRGEGWLIGVFFFFFPGGEGCGGWGGKRGGRERKG